MFLTEALIRCWSKLPGQAVDPSSLEVFISKLEVNHAALNTAATIQFTVSITWADCSNVLSGLSIYESQCF